MLREPQGRKIVGLFGGAFDPPHLAHAAIISTLLKSNLVNEIWIVPSGDRPDKPEQVSAKHRLAMLQLLFQAKFQNEPRVRIEACQVNGLTPSSYTIELLDYLRARYPDYTFLLIIGSELIGQLNTWKSPQRLEAEAKFIALHRFNQPPPQTLPKNVSLFPAADWVPIDISSTQVRTKLKQGLAVSDQLTASVENYIRTNLLYQN